MNDRKVRERLEYRRGQVARDIEELEDQVESGQVESLTADRLRGVYGEELTEIDEALAAIGDVPVQEEETLEDTGRVRGFSFTAVVVAGTLLTVLTGLIIWAGTASGPDPSATGDSSREVIMDAGEIDINAMSEADLEDALARFPDSTMVRLAVADRHLARGDKAGALGHYLVVAEGDALPHEKSRALARVGYLSYATGQHELAKGTLLESLSFNEDNTEAMLYLGYVLLNGFGDEAGAIPYFERVVADPSMPSEIVEAVAEILDDARRGKG